MAETLGAVTKDGSQWCDYERERQTGPPCTARVQVQLQIQIQVQNVLQLVTESRSGSGRTSRSGCACDVACAPVKVARKKIRVSVKRLAQRPRESHRLGVKTHGTVRTARASRQARCPRRHLRPPQPHESRQSASVDGGLDGFFLRRVNESFRPMLERTTAAGTPATPSARTVATAGAASAT